MLIGQFPEVSLFTQQMLDKLAQQLAQSGIEPPKPQAGSTVAQTSATTPKRYTDQVPQADYLRLSQQPNVGPDPGLPQHRVMMPQPESAMRSRSPFVPAAAMQQLSSQGAPTPRPALSLIDYVNAMRQTQGTPAPAPAPAAANASMAQTPDVFSPEVWSEPGAQTGAQSIAPSQQASPGAAGGAGSNQINPFALISAIAPPRIDVPNAPAPPAPRPVQSNLTQVAMTSPVQQPRDMGILRLLAMLGR